MKNSIIEDYLSKRGYNSLKSTISLSRQRKIDLTFKAGLALLMIACTTPLVTYAFQDDRELILLAVVSSTSILALYLTLSAQKQVNYLAIKALENNSGIRSRSPKIAMQKYNMTVFNQILDGYAFDKRRLKEFKSYVDIEKSSAKSSSNLIQLVQVPALLSIIFTLKEDLTPVNIFFLTLLLLGLYLVFYKVYNIIYDNFFNERYRVLVDISYHLEDISLNFDHYALT
jgi:hypothetical protein